MRPSRRPPRKSQLGEPVKGKTGSYGVPVEKLSRGRRKRADSEPTPTYIDNPTPREDLPEPQVETSSSTMARRRIKRFR